MSTENDSINCETRGVGHTADGAHHEASGRVGHAVAPDGRFPTLLWAHWPLLDYASGLSLQHRLVAARSRDEIPDLLAVTEHPATVTLGRRSSRQDLLLGPGELAARGIALYQVGRGGHATFHGPGQLVVYPIVNLRSLRIGPRRFVEMIEGALVQVLRAIGMEAEGGKAMPGVWVGNRKIAALGVEIVGGISRHGLSLNLRGDLEPFELIVPCGAPNVRPISVEALGISPPRPIDVAAALASELGTMLGLCPCRADAKTLFRKTRRSGNDGPASLG